MEKQAVINIGMIGHVAHGKTTLVSAISGVRTVRFKCELEKNITIKLGYANTKIYKCDDTSCKRPDCYQSFESTIENLDLRCRRTGCSGMLKLVRHVSFVDCPGHDVLMATMINGTSIMDAAILLIAANETCPQPQTQEHLCALERGEISKIIIVQNKIDLLTRERCLEQYDSIREFLKGKNSADAPVIPVSAQFKVNVSALLDYIVNYIPLVDKVTDCNPKLVIIRSFDVNKPGVTPQELCGGIIGGSLLCGKLKIGDKVEIRPGHVKRENGRLIAMPYVTEVLSLKTENTDLTEAYPGGLIGIGTALDPSICIADGLVGNILGLHKGKLPSIYVNIEIKYEIFDEVASFRNFDPLDALNVGEKYLLNIGSCSVHAFLKDFDDLKFLAVFELIKPVCCDLDEKIALSKNFHGGFRLIGYGKLSDGEEIKDIVYQDSVYNLREMIDTLESSKEN